MKLYVHLSQQSWTIFYSYSDLIKIYTSKVDQSWYHSDVIECRHKVKSLKSILTWGYLNFILKWHKQSWSSIEIIKVHPKAKSSSLYYNDTIKVYPEETALKCFLKRGHQCLSKNDIIEIDPRAISSRFILWWHHRSWS